VLKMAKLIKFPRSFFVLRSMILAPNSFWCTHYTKFKKFGRSPLSGVSGATPLTVGQTRWICPITCSISDRSDEQL
ncbi:hypothetical protein, partial [Pasteurella multocida]|uniref:hypothetical protein n=1 Tax=Pasteurella multocida TaxID=747 RepID=UPI00397A674B